MLDIYAGSTAYKVLCEEGLHPDQFDVMLGASGGPKWFTIAGLDRVIVPEFFKGRTKPLNLVGSSAGAFRFACLAQEYPLKAINLLAERYSNTVYSENPTVDEISESAGALLSEILADGGAQQIIENETFLAHFSTVRSKGLTQSENKYLLGVGLLGSAAANLVSRTSLKWFYERVLFSVKASQLKYIDPNNISSSSVELTKDNVADALLASGAIPAVLKGIKDIDGGKSGMYRDGGVVDYHFDLAFPEAKLVLYPHFYSKAIPGWFDKFSGLRKPHKDSYHNVVLLCPSPEFVKALPFNKIPDRKDFEDMDAETRIKYWTTVLQETDRLGEEFLKLSNHAQLLNKLKPLPFACK